MIALDDIFAGLAADEFYLEYLPTVRLADGRCVGCEALIRWRRPTGPVAPAEFIPRIENTPLAWPLTDWVMRKVATDLGAWLRSTPGVHVGVNVPPETLNRAVAGIAADPGLAGLADKLVLEVAERGVPDQVGPEAINAGADKNIHIALDDVGATGVRFGVLSQVRVGFVKITRAVTNQLGTPAADDFVRDVAGHARVVGAEVIAIGVERPAQAAALRKAGVGLAQGWLYSHSIPAAGIMPFQQSREPIPE